MASQKAASTPPPVGWPQRRLPCLCWLPHYSRRQLSGDLLAGVIVAIMLAPQSMAYALLAGLPPQAGLYASIAPPVIYGLLGGSPVLAVGPVAIVSLLVATTVAPLANGDPVLYGQLAVALAFLVGLIQWAMAGLRLGFLARYLTRPVLLGFTTAAALVIGLSQMRHLLGVSAPRGAQFFERLAGLLGSAPQAHPYTLAIGAGAVAILLANRRLPLWLAPWIKSPSWRTALAKSAPLQVVVLGVTVVSLWGLDATGVRVVGALPSGLPQLTPPVALGDWWLPLLPGALTISFVGYLQSISAAKALARQEDRPIDPGQELVALGAANLAASASGGMPVTGGLSRSVVNASAGATTGMASIFTAGLMTLTVLYLAPAFRNLPTAVLAAIILVAVSRLVDVRGVLAVWQRSRLDGIVVAVTFLAVLWLGFEWGILTGVAVSLAGDLWFRKRS